MDGCTTLTKSCETNGREFLASDDLEGTALHSPESLPLSEENSDTSLPLSVQLDTSMGKVVNRENLAGVRVGSAGSSSLKVSLKDWMVRSMLRSKT
jgi:hypothetical protein